MHTASRAQLNYFIVQVVRNHALHCIDLKPENEKAAHFAHKFACATGTPSQGSPATWRLDY